MRLPEKLENKLNNLAKKTGRSKSYYVRQATEEFIAVHEDYLLAISRLEKNNPKISIDEIERRLDSVLTLQAGSCELETKLSIRSKPVF